MNKAWHQRQMPDWATLDQRLQWHLAHARHCACRPMPVSVLEALKVTGLAPPVALRRVRS
jgi:hypothetical protein